MLERMKSEIDMTFRHLLVLKAVKENQPIGIFKLSELLKLPNHKVRYSLRILEQAGLIRPSPQGAIVTERLEKLKKQVDDDIRGISEKIEEIKTLVDEMKLL